MSNEAIDLARQKRLPFKVNRGQEIDFTILVNNADGTPYDFTDHEAELYVYNSFNKTDIEEYEITVALSLGSMRFTHDAITRKKENFVYKLWITDADGYRQIWTNGDFLVLDSEVNHEDSEDTIIISPDGDEITLVITPLGGGGGGNPHSDEWELETFTTVLTFDNNKHLTTVERGTRTFTLSATDNLNGVEIIARIDQPVAVNFPSNFEAVNGSDEIDTSLMNIIKFTYFEDYDTEGNDKVLYEIRTQATTIVDFYLLSDNTSRYLMQNGIDRFIRP